MFNEIWEFRFLKRFGFLGTRMDLMFEIFWFPRNKNKMSWMMTISYSSCKIKICECRVVDYSRASSDTGFLTRFIFLGTRMDFMFEIFWFPREKMIIHFIKSFSCNKARFVVVQQWIITEPVQRLEYEYMNTLLMWVNIVDYSNIQQILRGTTIYEIRTNVAIVDIPKIVHRLDRNLLTQQEQNPQILEVEAQRCPSCWQACPPILLQPTIQHLLWMYKMPFKKKYVAKLNRMYHARKKQHEMMLSDQDDWDVPPSKTCPWGKCAVLHVEENPFWTMYTGMAYILCT